MKLWQKIILIIFHLVALTLLIFILCSGLQLRWRLGYVIFWGTALSAICFLFIRFNKEFLNIAKILYVSLWGVISLIGLVVTIITFDSVYCETDKYIMKESSELIGFDTAILYEKKGLLETKKYRYQGVYPTKMIPLDSIGAIVIYGKFFTGGPEFEEGVDIFPMEYKFDKERAKEYAQKHNIRIGNYN